jgi:hypothetical protein
MDGRGSDGNSGGSESLGPEERGLDGGTGAKETRKITINADQHLALTRCYILADAVQNFKASRTELQWLLENGLIQVSENYMEVRLTPLGVRVLNEGLTQAEVFRRRAMQAVLRWDGRDDRALAELLTKVMPCSFRVIRGRNE